VAFFADRRSLGNCETCERFGKSAFDENHENLRLTHPLAIIPVQKLTWSPRYLMASIDLAAVEWTD